MKPFVSVALLVVFVLILLQGCATTSQDKKIEKGLEASENVASAEMKEDGSAEKDEKKSDEQANERDPLEGFNRAMYTFNEKVDNYVAEPIANAYKWITPDFVQKGISNFFTNTKNINVVLNDVFQGKFSQSAEDTGRFLVNTTMGVAGLFDVAKYMGLEQHEEDFDQTLSVWGVPKGAYLVLPILGPATARGIPGYVFDTAANPITYVGLPAQVLAMLNARANAEGSLKFIDEAALDPYVFTRESFLQWRDYLSADGKAKASDLNDEFEDELDDDSSDKKTDASQPAAAKKPAAMTSSSNQSLTQNNDAPKHDAFGAAEVAGIVGAASSSISTAEYKGGNVPAQQKAALPAVVAKNQQQRGDDHDADTVEAGSSSRLAAPW